MVKQEGGNCKDSYREILDMESLGITVFEEFGRYNYIQTQEILPAHTHGGAVEICYMAKGEQTYVVEGEVFTLNGGEAFVVFPHEHHGTNNMPEQKGTLYWLSLLPPQEGRDYLGLSYEEAAEIFFHLTHLPSRKFFCAPAAGKMLQKIFSLYRRNDLILKQTVIRNLIVGFLLSIIENGRRNGQKPYSDAVSEAVRYIREHIREGVDLTELAEAACLSVSRFKHRFKTETGIPPAEFIIREKLRIAESMLTEQHVSIAEIAYDLGFSSPSHFATVFKQYKGTSPSDFRKHL